MLTLKNDWKNGPGRYVSAAMSTLARPVTALILAGLLGSALWGQEPAIKWSGWHAIDERFSLVRIRTSRDDNDGLGWGDGSNHWRVEIKNSFPRATVRVALEFARWNPRTRIWDPPAEPATQGFELEPGETHEDTAVGESKSGFDYRYVITLVPGEGKPPRTAAGFANSRVVAKLIAESSLVTQAAFVKAMAEERRISAGPDPVAAPPPVETAKPVLPKPAPAPTATPATVLPATLPAVTAKAPALPPASVEGLSPAEKFALWQQRAAQGEAAAMFELGRACRYGAGTALDHAQATEWYRQAALRGHAGAMTKLGYAYDSGLGVERDANAALDWWRKAAALGDPDATAKLTRLGLAP